MESSTPHLLCDCLANPLSVMYLRGSRTQSTGRFSPLTSLDRTGRSSPTDPFSFLFSFFVSPFSPRLSSTKRRRNRSRPDHGLPSPVHGHRSSSLALTRVHLEMADDKWYHTVVDVAGNFSKFPSNYQAGDNYTRADINAYNALVVTLYCAQPPDNDDCPIGVCPNPDVAGTLLRIARKFPLSFLPRTVI